MVASITLGAAVAAIGAGIDILGGAIATGIAQAGIGSAGIGLIAEKPEEMGRVLLFLVLPETLMIFGFVVAVLIMLGAGFV